MLSCPSRYGCSGLLELGDSALQRLRHSSTPLAYQSVDQREKQLHVRVAQVSQLFVGYARIHRCYNSDSPSSQTYAAHRWTTTSLRAQATQAILSRPSNNTTQLLNRRESDSCDTHKWKPRSPTRAHGPAKETTTAPAGVWLESQELEFDWIRGGFLSDWWFIRHRAPRDGVRPSGSIFSRCPSVEKYYEIHTVPWTLIFSNRQAAHSHSLAPDPA